jgi:hypothetical protein
MILDYNESLKSYLVSMLPLDEITNPAICLFLYLDNDDIDTTVVAIPTIEPYYMFGDSPNLL